jgi:hypothetical protein
MLPRIPPQDASLRWQALPYDSLTPFVEREIAGSEVARRSLGDRCQFVYAAAIRRSRSTVHNVSNPVGDALFISECCQIDLAFPPIARVRSTV